ncbi:hypothetical protein HPB52_014233 [Rhipicephalus sanguineus]|uniref:Protein kinase domain-containing protein n=1 Tax=Rhipicephalus sanguineus TaxID=34632 RepID=A0A9D4YQ58_RHISA|nr:hypothetical protein HPB52_014233 [Rhipicephalus sanguineus]
MSRFRCCEPNEYNGAKYRFITTDMFGEVLQKILDRQGKMPASKTTSSLGMLVIDVLEGVHSYEPIHADVKAHSRLLVFGEGSEDRMYLLDFGLACRYMQNGKPKEYKEDFRKAYDGTTEFTSRDADIGVHSRRADMERLGYNLLRFMATKTIREDSLKVLNWPGKTLSFKAVFSLSMRQTQNHEAGNRNAPRLAKMNRSARKHPLRSTSCQIEPSDSVGRRPETTVKKKKVFTRESMP